MKYPDKMYVRNDVVLISYPKSGRTWLRMMIAKTLELIGENCDKEYFRCEHWTVDQLHEFGKNKKKLIYLIRDPRDVVVSEYFENCNPKRKHPYEGTITEWLRSSRGLKKVLAFQKGWGNYLGQQPKNCVLVPYEVLREFTWETLTNVLRFLKVSCSVKIRNEAIAYCDFENMKKLEAKKNLISDYRGRYGKDSQHCRVRRGVVGDWRNYFKGEDLDYIEKEMECL